MVCCRCCWRKSCDHRLCIEVVVVPSIVVWVVVVVGVEMTMFFDHTQCIWVLVVVAVVVVRVVVVVVIFVVQQVLPDVADRSARILCSIPWVPDHTAVVDDAIANSMKVAVVAGDVAVVDDWLENLHLLKVLGLGLVRMVVWVRQLFVLPVLFDHGQTIYHRQIEWLEIVAWFWGFCLDDILRLPFCKPCEYLWF